METDVGLPPITYNPVPCAPSLTYNQNNQLQTLSNQSPGLTDNQPQNTRPTYNRPIGIEQTLYLCTLCETPTKFADYHRLSKHVERFHSAFNQDNKGVKRGKGEREEAWPKKLR